MHDLRPTVDEVKAHRNAQECSIFEARRVLTLMKCKNALNAVRDPAAKAILEILIDGDLNQ